MSFSLRGESEAHFWNCCSFISNSVSFSVSQPKLSCLYCVCSISPNHRPVYQIDCDSGVSCCDFLTSPVPSRYYDLLGMWCFGLSLWLNAHPTKKEFVYVSESQSIWCTGLWTWLKPSPTWLISETEKIIEISADWLIEIKLTKVEICVFLTSLNIELAETKSLS